MFHQEYFTGPSDQDVNYAFNSKMKQLSIVGFYMDETEIIITTNTVSLLSMFAIL